MGNEVNARDMIGQVYERGPITEDSNGMVREVFLGGCFCLWDEDCFLTAAHCVEGYQATDLFVWCHFGAITQSRPVTWIVRHDDADVAVLICEEMGWGEGEGRPFPAVRPQEELLIGQPFYAFGFPTDSLRPEEPEEPTQRLFSGRFQRFLWHESHMGYQYRGGEMSIPAPEGLSGGPVFTTGGELEVFGLVSENLVARKLLDRERVEREDNGERVWEEYRVITYGICVLLGPLSDWLRRVIGDGI